MHLPTSFEENSNHPNYHSALIMMSRWTAWCSSASAGGLQNTVTGMIPVLEGRYSALRLTSGFNTVVLIKIASNRLFLARISTSISRCMDGRSWYCFTCITCDVQVHFAIGWCSNRTDFDFRYHRPSSNHASISCGSQGQFFRQVISNEAHDPERFMQACPCRSC